MEQAPIHCANLVKRPEGDRVAFPIGRWSLRLKTDVDHCC
jgi:hypothetical protein